MCSRERGVKGKGERDAAEQPQTNGNNAQVDHNAVEVLVHRTK